MRTEWNSSPGLRSRFWAWAGQNLSVYGNLATLDSLSLGPRAQMDGFAAQYREFFRRWSYYVNDQLYRRLRAAGLVGAEYPVEWNPVPATVDFYIAHTLSGDLVLQIPERDDGQPLNENLTPAVEQIWEWSNFSVFKQDLVRTTAALGSFCVKVAERVDGEETTAVYLQDIPPETIRSVEVDERGYLTAIRIETPREVSVFNGNQFRHVLVEYWAKQWPDEDYGGVRYYEVPTGAPPPENLRRELIVDEQTFTELGYDFIPIVWSSVDMTWFHQLESIDRYNALAMKADRLNRPMGLVHGRQVDPEGKPLPAPRVTGTEIEATYEEAKDGVAGFIRVPGLATFEWAPPSVDLTAIGRQMEAVRTGVEESLPEYRVATLDARQISTDTMQMLLSQAAQRVLHLRHILEQSLIRAQEMALTIGAVAQLEQFTTVGVWENGDFEHSFVGRDVFPPSPMQLALTLKELQAAGLPVKLAMKAAGFAQELIDEYDDAAAAQASQQRDTLAAALLRQQESLDRGGPVQ